MKLDEIEPENNSTSENIEWSKDLKGNNLPELVYKLDKISSLFDEIHVDLNKNNCDANLYLGCTSLLAGALVAVFAKTSNDRPLILTVSAGLIATGGMLLGGNFFRTLNKSELKKEKPETSIDAKSLN